MAASARIAHHVPGRMRIRVHGAKRNPKLLDHLKSSIYETEGVTRVEANRDTGSLVVHYRHESPKRFVENLTELGQSSETFHLDIGEAGQIWASIEKEANLLAAHSELARSVVNETKRLDVAVKRATDNTVDLKVLVPLGLAAVSLLYVGTDISTPLWLSLGVFSFNSFVSLHPPLPFPRTENEAVPRDEGS
jgi:hypothetical protein